MPTNITGIFFSFAAAALLWPAGVFAQVPPKNPWGDVKRIARLTPAQQREPANQQVLQNWFMAKIRFYQHVLDDTAIGQTTPRVVDLGDWAARFRQTLAPPTGTGTTTITFGARAAPSTMDDNLEIIFPQASADSYIDDHPDTCWHEFNHVLVILSERNGRPVAIPSSPWMVYAKPGDNSNPEHIYIEGLAEYTTEWLDLLLHERSALTGGAGMAFEKHCRDAYEQIKKYEARNESITYAVENFCWAKAHDAYCRAWKEAGHKVAPLPLKFRQDYQQICGVWIGFVEDIVRVYMKGALRAADGTPIRVPEWVMNPEPMRTGVIVGHLDEKKEISGDTLRYGFDVRVMENYRFRESSDSLNHGKVLITLTNPDSDTELELSVDAKPVNRSAASGKIDLAGFKRNSRIRLTLVRRALSSFVGVKRYTITVEYQPDPRIENGVTKPPFYYPSKAIYYVDVTGSGTGAKTKTAKGPASTGTTTSAGGMWRLEEVIRDKKFDPLFRNQNITEDTTVSDTSINIVGSQQLTDPPRTITWNSRHTWTHPGQTLTPGTKVPVAITLDSSHSGPSCLLEAWVLLKTAGIISGLFDHPTSGGKDSNGGGVCLNNNDTSGSKTVNMPIPEGYPGNELIVRVSSTDAPVLAEVRFRYVWEAAGAKPETPAKADAVLKAEEPAPEPVPPGMDNVPPEPGELVVIPKTEEKTPPKTKHKAPPADNWYVHPTNDYKFKLSAGWTVAVKKFFDENDDEYDTLWPAAEDMAIVCSRSFTENASKTADAVLSAFAAKMLRSNPGAESARIKLGAADVQQIAAYDKNNGVATWHLGLFHKGRSYYIAVSMPLKTAPKKVPDPPAWMLGSIVFSR